MKNIINKYLAVVTVLLAAVCCFTSCNNSYNDSAQTRDTDIKQTDSAADSGTDDVTVYGTVFDTAIEMRQVDIDEAELLALMEMTFKEIEAAGYELRYLYSVDGPGAPTYALGDYDGILVRFPTDDNFEVKETYKPWLIEISNPSVLLFGLKAGMSAEQANAVHPEWDFASISGKIGVYSTAKKVGDYHFIADREIPDKEFNEFCASNNINKEDHSIDELYYNSVPLFAETQKTNPSGKIIGLELSRYY